MMAIQDRRSDQPVLGDLTRWYRGLLRLLLRPAVRRHISLSIPIKVNRATWRVPVIEGIEVPGVADNWKSRVLATILPLGEGSFVDIGANLGQTFLDLRRIDSYRYYVGFEPNPTCVYYMRRLIEVNRFGHNSTIVGAAVAAESGIARLYFRSASQADESATTLAGFRPERKLNGVVHVPVVALDEVWSDISDTPVAMVKIDVEGAEVEVLSGMRQTLLRDRPVVLCEILPAPRGTALDITRQRHAAVEALVHQSGFTILNVDRDDRGDLLGLVPIDQFPLRYWSPEARHRHDYVFVHADACEAVMQAMSGQRSSTLPGRFFVK